MAKKVEHPLALSSEEPTVPLKEHLEALRVSDQKFQDERDRRYTEVKNAEEKALRIKEQADRDALGLAREIQTYKDEKANELREQISRERGLYVTQMELKPVSDFVAQAQGSRAGSLDTRTLFFAIPGVILGFIGIIAFVISLNK